MSEEITLLKALSHDARMRILRVLQDEELGVNEMTFVLRMPQSMVSRHLATLRRAGLVSERQEGTWRYYRVDREGLDPAARHAWQFATACFPRVNGLAADMERLDECLRRRRDQSRRFFDKVGEQWEKIRDRHLDAGVQYRSMAGLVSRSLSVADLGAGTGALALKLAPLVTKVIGVDNSDEMIAIARSRAKDQGLTNVEFRRGEIDSPPLRRGEVDAAMARFVLHHLPNPGKAISAIANLLPVGAKLVVTDLVEHNVDAARQEMGDFWLGFAEDQIKCWLADAGLTDTTFDTDEQKPSLVFRTFTATATKASVR